MCEYCFHDPHLLGCPNYENPTEEKVFCDKCKDDISEEEIFYDEDYDNLCLKCLMYLHVKERKSFPWE